MKNNKREDLIISTYLNNILLFYTITWATWLRTSTELCSDNISLASAHNFIIYTSISKGVLLALFVFLLISSDVRYQSI